LPKAIDFPFSDISTQDGFRTASLWAFEGTAMAARDTPLSDTDLSLALVVVTSSAAPQSIGIIKALPRQLEARAQAAL
jgi:hypothetical protein